MRSILVALFVTSASTMAVAATYEMDCGNKTYRLVNNFFKKALYERRDGVWQKLSSFDKENCQTHCYQKIEIYDDGARKDYFDQIKINGRWEESRSKPLYIIYDFYKNTRYISFSGNTTYCEKVR